PVRTGSPAAGAPPIQCGTSGRVVEVTCRRYRSIGAIKLVDMSAPLESAVSATIMGALRVGDGALVAQGAVVRSLEGGIEIGAGSAVLENCVAVGTPVMPTVIGRRAVFGHRCLIVGAEVGDLCEIGNASIL